MGGVLGLIRHLDAAGRPSAVEVKGIRDEGLQIY